MATSLEGLKNNFQINYLHPSSTNPENLAKVVPADVEIFGLTMTGIVKIYFLNKETAT